MNTRNVIKLVSAVVGGVTAVTLVSLYPVKVVVLAVSVLAWVNADKVAGVVSR